MDDQRLPSNPCNGCVPPERNAECHARCERYLEWEAIKNKRRQERWSLIESSNYVSREMMKRVKRIQMRK